MLSPPARQTGRREPGGMGAGFLPTVGMAGNVGGGWKKMVEMALGTLSEGALTWMP